MKLPLGKVGPADQICASGIFLHISQTPIHNFIIFHNVSHIMLIVSDNKHIFFYLSLLLPYRIYGIFILTGSY